MTSLKIVRPSGSFSLMLPNEVCDEQDGRIRSFWIKGRALLLQLSSYVRSEGRQIGANERLSQRMSRDDGSWKPWAANIHPDSSVDQASAELMDEEGVLWVHSYLVWPHLTVYATISGPEELVRDTDSWAIKGVASIRLTIQ